MDLKHVFILRQHEKKQQFKREETITRDKLMHWLEEIKEATIHIELKNVGAMANQLLWKLNNDHKQLYREDEWSRLMHPLFIILQQEGDTPIEEIKDGTVLLFNDNLASLNHCKAMIEDLGYTINVATTRQQLIKRFYDRKPDILMLDASTDVNLTHQLVKRLRERATEAFIPIVIFYDTMMDEDKQQFYDEDVNDILSHDVSAPLLDRFIENRLRYRRFLQSNSFIDELTKAYNRSYLDKIWWDLTRAYHHSEQPFSLALIDLDHFKTINDTYGHNVGDDVLVRFSSLFFEMKRPEDYFIRYGGEEFIMLLPQMNRQEAVQYMDEIRERFEAIAFHARQDTFQVTFTVGLDAYQGKADTLQDLTERADKALYLGKEAGRNQVYSYQEDLRSEKRNVIQLALVDDDAFMRSYLTDRLKTLALSEFAVEVTAYPDAETFLTSNWLTHEGKKLLILDLILPGLSGIELLEEIEMQLQEDRFNCLMITGQQKSKEVIKGLERGASDYMIKPFDFNQLVNHIIPLL
ncbi:diguanylate cyclase (GGDEF)-like protein [Streptohalobacillus salinus]|uniref:Diguanylate cyclase (GGDEF)-like protein n=1 Tax=Streptohalobacillus salinus TaxID=621096 RepID=A0A2V3WDW6_9BACI|nr:diguanylate cyclase [Streptohalobacillus salinus]PXW93106.1 diguanylate cyclase (GGDEF)-like protein [Streptohalobacillus salinus]